MFILYIKGLLAIVGFIAYPLLFNWIGTKIFKDYDPLDNNYGAIGAMILPYVLTLAVVMILLIPLVIGKELFGG
jgi:hypothetical protein